MAFSTTRMPWFLLLSACLSPGIATALTVDIVNLSGDSGHLRFGGASPNPVGKIAGNAIDASTNYSVANNATLSFELTSFESGRLLLSRNGTLSSSMPQFQNGFGPDSEVRWDKVELSLFDNTTSQSVANLSSTDFYGMGIKLETYSASNPNKLTNTLSWNTGSDTLFPILAAVAGNNPDAVVKAPVSSPDPDSTLRVISPSTVPLPVIGSFQSFAPYLDAVKASSETVGIKGQYLGPTTASGRNKGQGYDFVASFNAAGDLELTGSGTVVGPNHTIIIKAADLETGIYSTNPPYTVDGAASSIGANDVYSATVRDILAGFNFGFIGSSAINPNTGNAYKDDTSDKWYFPPVAPSDAFGFAQPDHSAGYFYNNYAAIIAGESDSYGFPFSDLLGRTFADLNPANTGRLVVTLLPDNFTGVSSPAPIPAPGGLILLGTGLFGLIGARRR